MINKKKTLSVFAVIVIVGSLFFSSPVNAANPGFLGGNFFSGFITFIAQKFGLDKTQVQNAAKDYQQQTKATITPRPTMNPQQRLDAEKKRLDVLVNQKKITADQENAILTELAAVRAQYPLDPNATSDQRKIRITNIQNALKTWLQSSQGQGIDQTYVLSFDGGRGFRAGKTEGGFRGNRGPKPTTP